MNENHLFGPTGPPDLDLEAQVEAAGAARYHLLARAGARASLQRPDSAHVVHVGQPRSLQKALEL